MKRSGKAQPPPAPGASPPAADAPSDRAGSAGGARPPAGRNDGDERASRPDAVESVAGEEDPGSALEQFSDLMQGSPVQGGPAAEAPAPQPPGAEPHRHSSDGGAEPSPAPRTGPGRRG